MAAAEQTFQKLVAQVDYPMFIATVATDEGRAGCLIGFATQCSIHPPRFLAGISEKNRTHRVAQRATAMGIHLVPEDATELAELFGGETGDDVDKFARCAWHPRECRCLTTARTASSAASSSEWTSATTPGWSWSPSSPSSREPTASSTSTARSASIPDTKPE